MISQVNNVRTANRIVFQDVCPSCRSQCFLRIGPPGTEFTTEVGSRSFYQPEYESRRCERCQLVFKSAIASPAELNEYYQCIDYGKWEYNGLFPTERRIVSELLELPPRSRILDFGCSSGRLLTRLVQTHYCFGCELNAIAAEQATDRGIKILDWEQVADGTETPEFDAIVLVDVFEHLTDPLDLLKSLVARLSFGGHLILCTGDSDAPAVRGEPSTFWYFRNIEHVCMLNRQHVAFLAQQLGLKIVNLEQMCHYDVTAYSRMRRRAANFAYEVFHRGRAPWLRPAFRILPGFRKAQHWEQRPEWTTTPDHLIVVFSKSF